MKSDRERVESMCIVMMTGALPMNRHIKDQVKLVTVDEVADHFVFPVGLTLLDDKDCALLSYHVSDDQSFVEQFCGLTSLLSPSIHPPGAKCLSDFMTPKELNKLVNDKLTF